MAAAVGHVSDPSPGGRQIFARPPAAGPQPWALGSCVSMRQCAAMGRHSKVASQAKGLSSRLAPR